MYSDTPCADPPPIDQGQRGTETSRTAFNKRSVKVLHRVAARNMLGGAPFAQTSAGGDDVSHTYLQDDAARVREFLELCGLPAHMVQRYAQG